jgi:hypothetical protein
LICAYNVKNFYGQANITGMNPNASCGVSYPPLCGIVQLTNSEVCPRVTLRLLGYTPVFGIGVSPLIAIEPSLLDSACKNAHEASLPVIHTPPASQNLQDNK